MSTAYSPLRAHGGEFFFLRGVRPVLIAMDKLHGISRGSSWRRTLAVL